MKQIIIMTKKKKKKHKLQKGKGVFIKGKKNIA